MKFGFYPRLAWDGIRKNKRLYVPYLLTCVGMVMMFYIIHYLAAMHVLNDMSGGRTTAQMLGFGTWIVMLFALVFLFYTNSFLMRRRKKELEDALPKLTRQVQENGAQSQRLENRIAGELAALEALDRQLSQLSGNLTYETHRAVCQALEEKRRNREALEQA